MMYSSQPGLPATHLNGGQPPSRFRGQYREHFGICQRDFSARRLVRVMVEINHVSARAEMDLFPEQLLRQQQRLEALLIGGATPALLLLPPPADENCLAPT